MAVNPAGAASAYADAIRRAAETQGGGNAGATSGIRSLPESFGDLLSQQVGNLETSAKAGEVAATQAAAGQGNVVDLVTKVSEAELVLQTAVTVRDRVIAAYQDIMKMPI